MQSSREAAEAPVGLFGLLVRALARSLAVTRLTALKLLCLREIEEQIHGLHPGSARSVTLQTQKKLGKSLPRVHPDSPVSKSAKVSAPPEEPPFEVALKELESIVESMESGELSLEDLLTKYETGSRLAQQCQRQLAAAEVRIQQLEQAPAGDQLGPVVLPAIGPDAR